MTSLQPFGFEALDGEGKKVTVNRKTPAATS